MAYKNEDILNRIKTAKANKAKLTHITDKSKLSLEDRLKISLCKHFVQFAVSNKVKLKEVSSMTSIPTTRLSEIMNYKITKFTVDQLVKNLLLLAEHDLKLKEYLHFIQEAIALPTMKVSVTRKLTKKISETSRAFTQT